VTDHAWWPGSAPGRCENRRALAQRALACELGGELELAVALIRRLQRPEPDAGDALATVRVPRPA
jgi:hypothetical protein